MFTPTITIARNTFIEAVRQPVFLVVVLLTGILQVLSTWGTAFSMGYTTNAEVSGDTKLLLDIGLATVFVGGTLLAAFVATSVLSREIENRTVLTVVSKPISRTSVILGKYLGTCVAMAIGIVIMLVFLLLAVRHGVMSTASDSLDIPVLSLGFGSVILAVAIAGWTNYFYGWSFPQMAVLLLFPMSIAAYLVVLNFNPEFRSQPIGTDFKPEVSKAAAGIVLSMFVLTAAATAASARLNQVMTIVVCAGVFVLGLLSNHLFGQHIYDNTPFARVTEAQAAAFDDQDFTTAGDRYTLTLAVPPSDPIPVGTSVYYGANPSGFDLVTPVFPVLDELDEGGIPGSAIIGDAAPGRVLVRSLSDDLVSLSVVNGGGFELARPPAAGDYLFTRPTSVRAAPLAIWGAIPNLQHFWLLDAVTKNERIPMTHLGLLAGYTLVQIGAMLCIAVLLFEKRDVG